VGAVTQTGYQPIRVNEYGWAVCPACGEVDGMEDGDTIYAVGPDRDEYDSPARTRGGWVETRGTCSMCGHIYSLVIGNHKGALAVMIASLGPAPEPHPWDIGFSREPASPA
jgi:hypothetical protein